MYRYVTCTDDVLFSVHQVINNFLPIWTSQPSKRLN